jgi:hypothetical protein
MLIYQWLTTVGTSYISILMAFGVCEILSQFGRSALLPVLDSRARIKLVNDKKTNKQKKTIFFFSGMKKDMPTVQQWRCRKLRSGLSYPEVQGIKAVANKCQKRNFCFICLKKHTI